MHDARRRAGLSSARSAWDCTAQRGLRRYAAGVELLRTNDLDQRGRPGERTVVRGRKVADFRATAPGTTVRAAGRRYGLDSVRLANQRTGTEAVLRSAESLLCLDHARLRTRFRNWAGRRTTVRHSSHRAAHAAKGLNEHATHNG